MAYYFVANYNVADMDMYKQYGRGVRPTLGQYGVKPLVFDHKPNDVEGESKSTLIVLEFESEEAFNKWYNSPEYQAVLNLRLDATEGWGRGAPGL